MKVQAWKTADVPGMTGVLSEKFHRILLWTDPEVETRRSRHAFQRQAVRHVRLLEQESACLNHQEQLVDWHRQHRDINQLLQENQPVQAMDTLQTVLAASWQEVSHHTLPDTPELWIASFYADQSFLTGDKLRVFEERILPAVPLHAETADFFADLSGFFHRIGKTTEAKAIQQQLEGTNFRKAGAER